MRETDRATFFEFLRISYYRVPHHSENLKLEAQARFQFENPTVSDTSGKSYKK
jgi:hypothetical protein